MKYEIPVWSKPVTDSELPPELRKKFRRLVSKADELYEVDEGSVRAATAARLNQMIQKVVKTHPILARTALRKKYTLLEVVFARVGVAGLETIQFLIEVNPFALLHRSTGSIHALIHSIAGSGWASEQLLWIAERYPWFFQHESCQQIPPHFALIESYVDGTCNLETVRRFYEIYPQGLREKDSMQRLGYPLWVSLQGSEEPDADFFIWMAKQCPIAVYFEMKPGYNILHLVCYFLTTEKCTPNMAKIGRFLVSEHPGLTRQQLPGHRLLPIHMLSMHFNRPLVQEIAILILKACPECAEERTASQWHPDLTTLPFIQQVYPLVMKELVIEQEALLLPQISQNAALAAVLPTRYMAFASVPSASGLSSSLFGSVSGVFCSWANLRVSHVLKEQKQLVKERIADTCSLLEGEDGPSIFALRDYFEGNDDDIEEDDVFEESDEDFLTEESDDDVSTEEIDEEVLSLPTDEEEWKIEYEDNDDSSNETDDEDADEDVNENRVSVLENAEDSDATYKSEEDEDWVEDSESELEYGGNDSDEIE